MTSLFDPPAPPFVHTSPTSEAAAEGIVPRAATLRRAVFDFIRSHGQWGATDEEGIEGTGIVASTYRPRRVELVTGGLVRDSGRTRPTKANRQAVVWIEVTDA